ncbi:hypothetical protein Daci_4114 [Delftia acidovorans SPH-1]|uniref:Uncharacterized protein n=1 Tax=Delftia acidovorans (strain DSM 14801 / SPH-1) TaxID=398578 RepID=A9C2U1_DELAS|nr:hypothetical protein [Delftia acidovorans]ABX36745.1 hypothetical protein Daci_4114 [Delftia acidovorans SPH-1]QPS73996.1 hypothetical protein I6G48_25695 [Delftia acidovorans]
MKNLIIAAAFAACSLTALADDFSYKGVSLGASMEQFQAALPLYQCKDDACTYTRDSCAPTYMRGGAAAFEQKLAECREGTSFGGGMVTYGRAKFIDGKFSSLYLIFPIAHARVVGDALEEKYGKPATIDTKPVKNRAGAEFDNWVKTWAKGDSDLVARLRASQIDEGSVSIRSAAAKAEEQARQQQQTKAGAKDF